LLGDDGKDWSPRLPSLVRVLQAFPVEQLWLDGELVALDARGISDPRKLRKALDDGDEATFRYFAFDLLHLDGTDLRATPLVARNRALLALLRGIGAEEGRVRYADHVEAVGSQVLQNARKLGLEGIVSKRADSPYRSGASNDWLVVPCRPLAAATRSTARRKK
jgi:bifunctional non-homologous end joining protein LigD